MMILIPALVLATKVAAFYQADWLAAFENFTDPHDGRPPSPDLVAHRRPMRRCSNGPSTRACWYNGYSVVDDYDYVWPDTGRTRYYDWEITNTTLAPDGFERMVLTVNGQIPGPTLYADWGDNIVVTIHNRMKDNGTTLHYHGLRMLDTNLQDGVPGVTQCPVAPGQTKTYRFKATQYGTSWYHSHFDVQYGDGLLGPIVIRGPATANYDIDLGPYTVTDWFHRPVAGLAYIATRTPGPPPLADNGLINGKMVMPNGLKGGSYHRTYVRRGTRYLLRLINTAVNDEWQVSLDGHDLLVIAADFIPIRPFKTHWLFLGIGQRYDVVITADQPVGNYWFRAEAQDQVLCGANRNNGNIKSIFSYENAPRQLPTTTGTPYTQSCADPPASSIVPFWNTFVPKGPLIEGKLDTAVQLGYTQEHQVLVKWGINSSAMEVDWSVPTLQKVMNGDVTFSTQENLIKMPDEEKWYYWIIQEVPGQQITINIPHPMHIHGHDFYILGSGNGTFDDAARANLNYNNPPRRDTAMLPTAGWLVVAFKTDNPGAWLMHCHIAWHSDVGFAVQFLEDVAGTLQLADRQKPEFEQTCEQWRAYYPRFSYYHRGEAVSGV